VSRRVTLISAVAENGVIGREGDLPWTLKDDMRWFMRRTKGATTIMGRRTFESMDGPLPERRNIVLTSREDWNAEGADVARGVDEALEMAGGGEVFVIGGESVYRAALPYATRIDLTRVHASPEGDTSFPEVDWSRWRRESAESHEADERNDHPFTIEVWTREAPERPAPA
jgi:dihydrofolate reductase